MERLSTEQNLNVMKCMETNERNIGLGCVAEGKWRGRESLTVVEGRRRAKNVQIKIEQERWNTAWQVLTKRAQIVKRGKR